jgi:hypothetical protein
VELAVETKICTGCRATLPIDEFNFKDKAADKRQGHCRVCQKKHSRLHYENNTRTVKLRTKERNTRVGAINRAYVNEYLRQHPCVDCGNNNIIVLEFDHVRGKKRKEVSHMIDSAFSLDSIIEEIAKCDVRCANCHRIRHHNERNNIEK